MQVLLQLFIMLQTHTQENNSNGKTKLGQAVTKELTIRGSGESTYRRTKKSIIETLNPLTNLNKHRGISAAGVLFLAKDTGRCLFQLRNSDKRQKHTWGFWGGIIENNESPYECIQRELVEEIGFVQN